VGETGVRLRDAATIAGRLAGVATSVVLYGHSYVPHVIWLPDGALVVNPGSVGVPAYSDGRPSAHRMETDSPHARYAVFTRGDAG